MLAAAGELENGGGTSGVELPAGEPAGFAGFAGFEAGEVFFFAGVAARTAASPRLRPAGPTSRQKESDTASSGRQVLSDCNNDGRDWGDREPGGREPGV